MPYYPSGAAVWYAQRMKEERVPVGPSLTADVEQTAAPLWLQRARHRKLPLNEDRQTLDDFVDVGLAQFHRATILIAPPH